jgi:hypothetical protein
VPAGVVQSLLAPGAGRTCRPSSLAGGPMCRSKQCLLLIVTSPMGELIQINARERCCDSDALNAEHAVVLLGSTARIALRYPLVLFPRQPAGTPLRPKREPRRHAAELQGSVCQSLLSGPG